MERGEWDYYEGTCHLGPGGIVNPSPGASAVVSTADLVALYQLIYSYQRIFSVLRDYSSAMIFSVSVDLNHESLYWTARSQTS